jgi:hypothetical protein
VGVSDLVPESPEAFDYACTAAQDAAKYVFTVLGRCKVELL